MVHYTGLHLTIVLFIHQSSRGSSDFCVKDYLTSKLAKIFILGIQVESERPTA